MIKAYFSEQACALSQPTGKWLGEGQVQVGRVPLYKKADRQAMQVTQLLFGERYDYYQIDEQDSCNNWYLVQSQRDAYVGYMYQADGVFLAQPSSVFVANAKVTRLTTALYLTPKATSPIRQELPFGAELCVAQEDNSVDDEGKSHPDYYFLPSLNAWVYKQHVRLNHQPHHDPVSLAHQFIGLSYLWGGRSGWGVDCSSLVQLCFEQCGCALPRDSGLQQEYAPAFESQPITRKEVRANDLLFWPGHVAIAASGSTLIHATGHGMQVIEEPIDLVCQRIYQTYQTQCTMLRPVFFAP